MGVEPFLYIADPEFLKQMSGCVLAKNWGKPSVFKSDRMPMFGEFGLNMIEGHTWTRHRHIITPAFSSINLKVKTINFRSQLPTNIYNLITLYSIKPKSPYLTLLLLKP